MISTQLETISRYKGLSPNLDRAIRWLEAGGLESFPEGRVEIDGGKVYALVQRYPTKALGDCRYEAHRNYIDIQLLLSGREIIQVRTVGGLDILEPYKPDIEFFKTPPAGTAHEMLLQAGTALILYPEDAHRPCIAVGGISEPAHKIVVKVAV
ncbi:MAG TPA: YhcH/YjgK/YiaL family protein [Rectinemataceae bacterium]|nr:YhcH/YjgK/YiaL family protein [Rectinemataceae bacterium]